MHAFLGCFHCLDKEGEAGDGLVDRLKKSSLLVELKDGSSTELEQQSAVLIVGLA